MMLFQGLWHALKVVSAAMFWLMAVALVWAGLALMGSDSHWGWTDIAVAIGLVAARGMISPRFVPGGASYVIGFAAQIVFLVIAAVLTGYKVS
ncbi:hypothetical protein [Asticcacaulis solisilvae]|uniref:hypothetical protein n=1 Tax=Asticcacaulis solisilvae TaxID=1217274 RepID=UPI003FD8D3D3